MTGPKPRVTVVGLGPGRPGLITTETIAAIEANPVRWLRTARHPSAGALPEAKSFDYLYETASSLEEVYNAMVNALVEAATGTGIVLYGVPGSPLVAERSVELLRADPRVETMVLPAVSFVDLAWEVLGVDPLAAGARLVDGHRFATEAAGSAGPLLVGQCDSHHVLAEVKLAIGTALDNFPASQLDVTVLHHLGLPDQAVTTISWDELDRSIHADHLTSVWVPRLAQPVAAEVALLDELARTLRAGCPWDREQSHQSLTRYLLEESYEVLEAIEELGPDGAGYEHLEEELGDLLFQVVFHCVLAAEQGQFSLADVARGARTKLVGRHPHVFGEVEASSAEQVMRNWEQIKRRERGAEGVMDEVPRNLPALLYAHKIQRKAASVGFDWPDVAGALAKIGEELSELAEVLTQASPAHARVRDELGDLLFAVVNVARHLKLDPETALREATAKFRGRFMAVEQLAAKRGLDASQLDLATLDELWEEVKGGQNG
jgi:tetrapyrrole methylase family protein/MazG family protein